MDRLQTTVLIVTYRSEDTIGACLDALQPIHAAGMANVIVLENASGDGTPAIVRRDHPWATLIENPGNLGYGRGLNAGLPHVSTPFVLFMNPDVTMTADALPTLVQFMHAHPNAGICGPVIVRGPGDYQPLTPLPTPWTLLSAAARLAPPHPRFEPGQPAQQSDWLCGAVMLCRTELVQRLGGFDPRFFLYFEETDLCVRVRRAGAELWAVGDAVVHHVGSSSTKKIDPGLQTGASLPEHFYRSRYYYLVKHHGRFVAMTTEVGELMLKGAADIARRVLRRDRKPSQFAERLRRPMMKMPDRVTAP